MSAWQELTGAQEDDAWDRFEAEFAFRPSVSEFPGIREPDESVTYDISAVYGDSERYAQLTLDLCRKLVTALRNCVVVGDVVLVLDWQHQCFQFDPHWPFAFESEHEWPIPVLPNGDYYIFLDPLLRFGVFGHPWERTMCVFGQPLLDAYQADLPVLFDRPMRIGGRVV